MEGGAISMKLATGILIARPLIRKAGIPLLLSVSGFVCARIVIAVRKRSTSRAGCGDVSTLAASMMKAPGTTDPADENREGRGCLCSTGLISTCTDSDSRSSLKLQLLVLLREITDLSERGLTLESRFLRYCKLKERELELLKIGYTLQLGRARLEMLHKEVARTEMDSKFLVQFSEACWKALEEVSYGWRVEKLRFRVKLKQMKRRVEVGGIKLREGRLKIEEKERELVEMRKENAELHNKLSVAEVSAKAETELACLRWSYACLKHELTKNHEEEKQEDAASSVNEEEEAGDNHAPHSPKKGRSPRIMKKLKRWAGWIGK